MLAHPVFLKQMLVDNEAKKGFIAKILWQLFQQSLQFLQQINILKNIYIRHYMLPHLVFFTNIFGKY